MSLTERLSQSQRSSQAQHLCKIGEIINGDVLSEEDKKALVEHLEMPIGHPYRLTNVAIVTALRDEGFDVSNSSMDRHRKQHCSCARKVNNGS